MGVRDYQVRTIDMIREKLRQGYKRILVTLPTGSGKSIIMGDISKMCTDNGKKVLALMHRRQLVEQLSDRFDSCGVDSGFIMAQKESDLYSKVQIGTVQTYSRRLNIEVVDFESNESYQPWKHEADVVFIDEAHRSLSKTFQDILAHYPNKVVLGFTATPSLASGAAMGAFYETLIQPVRVKELITGGFLVPGVYYGVSSPDLKGIKTVAGDYEKKELSERVNKTELIGDIVLNWSKIAPDKKTIVFAVNVKHSKAIVNEFKNHGIAAEHLDAHSSNDYREETLERFRTGETKIISNVDLYTEGTDIPDIECICLARPTKSIGRYLQMVGRGARPSSNKGNFIIIDHGKNVNQHGFYEDDITWTLEGKKIKYQKAERTKKEKHQMTCSNCSAIFIGKTCPECWTEIKDYGKKIEAIEFELKELNSKKKKSQLLKYPAKVLTGMLVSEARRLNKTDKWIRANYRNIMQRWPQSIDVKPIPASEELKNMLTHLRIKWIKSQKRLAA